MSQEFVDMESGRVSYMYGKVWLLDARNLRNWPLDQNEIEVEFYNTDYFHTYSYEQHKYDK